MSPQAAVDVIRQTASALDAAHAMNLIHRDVKPSNILLSPEDGRDGHDFVYLVDFGIARAADRVGELTGTGGVMGTPDYMAPERFEGRPIEPRGGRLLAGLRAAQAPHRRHALPGGEPRRPHVRAPHGDPAAGFAHARRDPRRPGLGDRPRVGEGPARAVRHRGRTRRGCPRGAQLQRARPRCRRRRRRRRPAGTAAGCATRPPPSTWPRRRRGHRGRRSCSSGAGTMGVRMLQSDKTLPTEPASSAPKKVRVSANLSVSGARTLLVDPTGTKLLLSAPADRPAPATSPRYRANVEIHDVADPTKVTTASLDGRARGRPRRNLRRLDHRRRQLDLRLPEAQGGQHPLADRRRDGRVRLSVPLPSAVIALALSPDGHRIYLTDRSSSFQVLDRATGARVASVPLGAVGRGHHRREGRDDRSSSRAAPA